MADPPWLAKCLENIARIPGGKLCSEQHCRDVANYVYAICHCQPPYQNGCYNGPTPGCCSYTESSPIYVMGQPEACYCCCGEAGSPAAVDVGEGGARPLEEIAVGDSVRAAFDPGLEEWALVPALFSSGTGAGGPGLEIRFGDPHELETVVADPDQLFLVAGRLKRASRLVAGQDRLTRSDGGRVAIFELSAVDRGGPCHRIATSEAPATDWAGHLIVVNGIVCGDYALQLADLEAARPGMMAGPTAPAGPGTGDQEAPAAAPE